METEVVDLTSSLFKDFKNLHDRIELDDDDYDLIFKVEKDCFKAHSIILKTRSEYFRNLINNESNKKLAIFKKNVTIEISDISPDVFKICLKYIYTGELLLEKYENEFIFDYLIVAADKLNLNDMVNYIQNHFKQDSSWTKKNLIKVYQVSLKYQNFKMLEFYCEKLIKQEPNLLFNSKDLSDFHRINLLSLIRVKRDDIPLQEVEIWRGLIKWGIGQRSPITKHVNDWNISDFIDFGRRIIDFVPYIRFFVMSSDEYYNDVYPYKNSLPENLKSQLEERYPMKKKEKKKDNNVRLSKRRNIIKIDSILINQIQIRRISHWIDGYDNDSFNEKVDINSNDDDLKPKRNFFLLARGSRDGMTREMFHFLCDNKGPTLILAKVEKTGYIIGGYNPNSWSNSNQWIETDKSFIFSFKCCCGDDDNNYEEIVLSRINKPSAAIFDGDYRFDVGFSSDLQLFNGEYRCLNYKERILDDYEFKITNYEVFQIENP